jgi:hypothetical protein
MTYTIEYHKELEEKDAQPGSYISRWSTLITINSYKGDIKGFPVFFMAKEGKLNNEQGFFNVTMNSRKDFYKAMH